MSNSQSAWRSCLFAIIVALGLAAAWGLAAMCVCSIVESARWRGQGYEQIYVGLDGNPYILRTRNRSGLPQQEIVTLTGQPAKVDTRSLLNPAYISPRMQALGDRSWHTRLSAVNDGGAPSQYWYLVHDGRPSGRVYGVGYDSRSKRVLGYFGRNGFADRMPPRSEWFQAPGDQGLHHVTPGVAAIEPSWTDEHVLYLLADGKLWAADPQQQLVRALADAPNSATLGWASDMSAREDRNSPSYTTSAWAPRKLVLRTDDSVTLIDPQTGEQAVYSLPDDLRDATLAAYQIDAGQIMLVSHGRAAVAFEDDSHRGREVVWLAEGEGVTRRQDAPLAPIRGIGEGPGEIGWTLAAGAPFPLGQTPTLLILPWTLVESGHSDSFPAAFGWMLARIWPAILAVLLIGAVAAVAAHRRQKRFALPHAVGWAVFAFLFGAPGWIAYRWHRAWPVLEDCPACGHLVPHDRDRCTECLATFPPPAMKGIEVFA